MAVRRVAYFVTPHGYGHATRSIAIMAALQELDVDVELHVFTAVKEALFRESLGVGFTYHREVCDVGLIQKDALEIDEAATVAALTRLLDPQSDDTDRLARKLKALAIDLVVCDIATLGLLAARVAGIPVMLVENFTWDFIYRGYAEKAPQVAAFATRFDQVFRQANYHVQIDPPSQPDASARLVPPVARSFKMSRQQMRAALGIAPDRALVLITTGGVGHQFDFCEALAAFADVTFMLSGQTAVEADNVLHLDGSHYHPDLVLAADLVVGKMGYSTLTETYHAGTPFAYICREDFAEGLALKHFADTQMSAAEISIADFLSGCWLQQLPRLLALEGQRGMKTNGADDAAGYVLQVLQQLGK